MWRNRELHVVGMHPPLWLLLRMYSPLKNLNYYDCALILLGWCVKNIQSDRITVYIMGSR